MCTIYRNTYSPCYEPNTTEQTEPEEPQFITLLNDLDNEPSEDPNSATTPSGLSTDNGNIVPIDDQGAAPTEPPADERVGSEDNPANDQPDGRLLYDVQSGDAAQPVARKHGYKTDDLVLLNPDLRNNPDGLPEFRDTPDGPKRYQILVLSDERLARVKSMVKLIDNAPSLDAMSDKDRRALQSLITLDIGEGAAGRGFDPKRLDDGLGLRRGDLTSILPDTGGLNELIQQTTSGFETYLKGSAGKPGLFAALTEPAPALGGLNPIDHGIKTGDWSHLQNAATGALRQRLQGVPQDRQETEASKLLMEWIQYGPRNEGFKSALIGNNDRTGALYQVMVKDPARQVYDAYASTHAQNPGENQDFAAALAASQRLEQLTRNMSAQRTDQLLRELGMPPDGSLPNVAIDPSATPPTAPSWNPATDGPHKQSILASITSMIGDTRNPVGDQRKTQKTIINHLNTVATQASGAQYTDANGKPVSGMPAGLKTLATGLVEALPSRDAPGNRLSIPAVLPHFHRTVVEGMGEGNAAALPAAMLELYLAKGQQRDAQGMAQTLRDGTAEYIENARKTTDEYGKLMIGDVSHVGGELRGWAPDAALQQQLEALGQRKRGDNAGLIQEFRDDLAGGLVLDAALTSLSPQARQMLGSAPNDLVTLLEGDASNPNAPEQPMLRVAFGDTFNGLGQGSDVPLAQLKAALSKSDGFEAFAQRYETLSDERFDDTFGGILNTYGDIQAALANPSSPPDGLPPLPPELKTLPAGIQEILTGLEGKNRQEQLAVLRASPAHGALLAEYLGMLDNSPAADGSPRPPSGYFLAREAKNTLATLGGAALETGQPVPHVSLRGAPTTSTPGMFTQPSTGIPLSMLNIVGGGLAIEEFAALGRFQGDAPVRADTLAWAYVFGGLTGHAGVQLSGGAGQLLVGTQPWQLPAGGKLDRFSGAAMRGDLPGMTVASRFLNVATAGVAYWTLGEEIADRDWPEAGAWGALAVGATMTGYASFGLAASGPVGWIGTGLWLGGAYAITKIGGNRARTYHEPDMRSVLTGLGVSDERARILATGREGGLHAPDHGASNFPLLKQLAQSRGVDVNDQTEFKAFTDMILYDEQALPNDKLQALLQLSGKVRWLENQGRYLQDPSVRQHMHPSKHDAYIAVEDLNAWIDYQGIPLPGRATD